MQKLRTLKKKGSCFTATHMIYLLFLCLSLLFFAPDGQAQEKLQPKQIWSDLLQRSPYPYKVPLALPKRTPIDGTYTKMIPMKETHVPCKRCPDWLPEGGIWKINFSKGTFRIIHADTAWRTMGSYFIAGDRIIFANDPVCHDVIGMYKWEMNGEKLAFELIDDSCAIRLRATNLTQSAWFSCRPPNREAAITEHWLKPVGCD